MVPNPTGCFVLCCAAGVLLGFVLHLRELPRRRPLAVKALGDLLYCGLCTGVLMLLCLTWNGGMLRLFQPVGMLLGMALYFTGFGVLTRRMADWLRRICHRLSGKAERLSTGVKTRIAAKKSRLFSRKTIDNS